MNPRLLQRRRRELEPEDTLLNEYALTPPTYEDTTEEPEELPEVELATSEEEDKALPEVMSSPEYRDEEDPVTRYSDYGTDEFNKLRGMEPVELKRRGPWHQILGGLASVSPITAGLAPNLVYKNYQDYKNQEQQFEQQKSKADIEAENRRTSLSAGTSAYGTGVQEDRYNWDQTVGQEIQLRQKGWAPATGTPQSVIRPDVQPITVNGVEYVQLKDPQEVSYSYMTPNADTGTNFLTIIYKDGTYNKQDTGIKPLRNEPSNINSMMREASGIKQLLQQDTITPEQKRQLEQDLSVIENTIKSVQEYEKESVESEAQIRARYRPASDGDTPEDTAVLRETVEYFKGQGLSDEEARAAALEKTRGPRDPNERPPGFPSGAESGEDARRVAGNIANIGGFKEGWYNFIPGVEGTTGEEVLANVRTANSMIVDLAQKTAQSRGEDMSGFLPSIHANITKFPKEFQKSFKEYINAYNESLPILQETGDDLWYHPTEGFVIVPRQYAEEEGMPLEQVKQSLQSEGFRQYRFITK